MKITVPRWSVVEAEANKLTAGFSAPPIPVLEIAESNGVDVVFAGFGELTDKVSGFCDFGAAKLFVNEADQMKEKIIAALNAAGIKTEGLSDDALFAEFQNMKAPEGKPEDKKAACADGEEDDKKAAMVDNASVAPMLRSMYSPATIMIMLSMNPKPTKGIACARNTA